MATWSTVRAQIRRDLEETTATVWTDDSLMSWANDASYDIAVQTKCMRDWQYTTAVVGQSSYDLPARSLEVIEAFFGDSATVGSRKPLDRQEFTDWTTLDDNNGTPLYYAVDDEAIYLRPPPLYAHELSYLRYTYPAAMTADGDSMPFTDRANAAISYYVKSKAKEQISDFDGADIFYDRYLREVDKFAAQIQKEQQADRYLAPATVW